MKDVGIQCKNKKIKNEKLTEGCSSVPVAAARQGNRDNASPIQAPRGCGNNAEQETVACWVTAAKWSMRIRNRPSCRLPNPAPDSAVFRASVVGWGKCPFPTVQCSPVE